MKQNANFMEKLKLFLLFFFFKFKAQYSINIPIYPSLLCVNTASRDLHDFLLTRLRLASRRFFLTPRHVRFSGELNGPVRTSDKQ